MVRRARLTGHHRNTWEVDVASALRVLAVGLLYVLATTVTVVGTPDATAHATAHTSAHATAHPNARVAPPRPLVMGHRGTRDGAPENTMPAFEYARKAGADAVEFDIYWTKATKTVATTMVIIHDPTLNRTTNCRGDVITHTWSQLKRCDGGSWLGKKWVGTRIPTFEQVLAWGKKHKMPMTAEIKGNLRATQLVPAKATITTKQAKQYIAAITKYKMTARVTMSSDSELVVRKIQAQKPQFKTGDIAMEKPTSKSDIRSYGTVYEASWHYVSPGNVATLHKLGMTVIIWPAGNKHDYVQALKTKADIILADDPAALRRWLDAGGHS